MTTVTPLIPGRRTRARRTSTASTIAAGYLRVSTADQAESGLGIDAQRAAITRTAEQQGLTLAGFYTDAGVSGSVAPDKRPGMAAALDTLADASAGVLIAAKIDRVSRSTSDALQLADRARREGWRLITADGLDSSDETPANKLMTNIQLSVVEWERDTIRSRTREALAELKARGVKLGHPCTVSDEVLTRIILELSECKSLREIGAGLREDGYTTATGKTTWHAQTVKQLAECTRAREITSQLFPQSAATNA
uniref:Resolvase/invertase-type recombinase catalytic domain-containing protein n=1 Tax=uncultured prokaryote TaxID=198431 RepID=A0A0H5PYJ9_9ZZZZ|nr:hypothetical protein [uncultured prokaryote]